MTTPRELWQQAFDASKVRSADFSTMSGVPLQPVYGPTDASGEYPGQYPYTRGPYASMYRSKLWTMRMFAGFGTADDTNWRFKEIIKSGGDGLSTAFDMPTLLGSTRTTRCRSARSGAAASRSTRWPTWRTCTRASTSADHHVDDDQLAGGAIFAMFIAQAEKAGSHRSRLGGTLQNDILKEYQAQKEFVFPPRSRCGSCATRSRSRGRDARVALGVDLRVPHP
jgi:methylmalonyl-CoA mutase N-terminal domain/subunit